MIYPTNINDPVYRKFIHKSKYGSGNLDLTILVEGENFIVFGGIKKDWSVKFEVKHSSFYFNKIKGDENCFPETIAVLIREVYPEGIFKEFLTEDMLLVGCCMFDFFNMSNLVVQGPPKYTNAGMLMLEEMMLLCDYSFKRIVPLGPVKAINFKESILEF